MKTGTKSIGMKKISTDPLRLIGMALPGTTSNRDNQSSKDIGAFWQKVHQSQFWTQIPEKTSNDLIAVYHAYEGDHLSPFQYFIGVQVPNGIAAPEGLSLLEVPGGTYREFLAKGKMPDCVGSAWHLIWDSVSDRSYRFDYEIYGAQSADWENAIVPIYISVK